MSSASKAIEGRMGGRSSHPGGRRSRGAGRRRVAPGPRALRRGCGRPRPGVPRADGSAPTNRPRRACEAPGDPEVAEQDDEGDDRADDEQPDLGAERVQKTGS